MSWAANPSSGPVKDFGQKFNLELIELGASAMAATKATLFRISASPGKQS